MKVSELRSLIKEQIKIMLEADDEKKPAEAKPEDKKDDKPADAKPADAKTADSKPADAKPAADTKPAAEKKPEDTDKAKEEADRKFKPSAKTPEAKFVVDKMYKMFKKLGFKNSFAKDFKSLKKPDGSQVFIFTVNYESKNPLYGKTLLPRVVKRLFPDYMVTVTGSQKGEKGWTKFKLNK